jgi:hypothetical protein
VTEARRTAGLKRSRDGADHRHVTRVLSLVALLLGTAIMLAASGDVFWNGDFWDEAWPAYEALRRGDAEGFLRRLPGYGTFAALVGGPATLLAEGLGGRDTTTFRLTAVPGVLALALLAGVLAAEARRCGARGWWLVLVLGAVGPLGYQALLYGHPEDLLAAGASVGAVLAARSGRVTLGGALVVIAVLAKQWAVLAIAPALLAAPGGQARLAAIAGIGTLALLGAETLLHPLARATMTTTGNLFHPHQLFWPLGVPAPPEFTAAGHGELTSPAWLRPLTRPLIVGLALPLALAWWLRAGRDRNRDDALALLALLFLARCALDPWNLVYYQLPLVLALLAWEVRRGREWPVLALGASLAAWLTFVTYDARTGMGPFLAYLAWVVPLAAVLAHALYARPRVASAPAPPEAALAPA